MSIVESRLGEVVDFIRGITFKPEDTIPPTSDNAVVCMRTKNIQKDLTETDLIAVPRSFVKRDELFLKEGDVLISSANSWNLVGKVCPVPALPYDATIGGFIAAIRAKSERISPRYLYRWLASEKTQAAIRACSRQTTNIANLSVPLFLDLPIAIPHMVEQHRIATILDVADSLVRKRKDAMRLEGEFLRALFIDMFGDFDSNPKRFVKGTIRDLVSSANYGTSQKADEIRGKYPILRMNNITYEGSWDLSSLKYVDLDEKVAHKYLARKGDLLFNRTNSKELVGKTAVFMKDEPMAVAGYLVRVRINEHGNAQYVAGYLNSAHGKRTLEGRAKSIVGMANINAQEMQDIPILLPPKTLQDKFAGIVELVQARTEKQRQFLMEADDLLRTLSRRLLS